MANRRVGKARRGRPPGRRRPPVGAKPKRGRRAVGLLGVIGVAVVALLVLLAVTGRRDVEQSDGGQAVSSEQSALTFSIPESMPVEQQIAVLKEETLKLAERVVSDLPSKAETLVLLGDVHRRFGDSAKAQECWDGALAMDPRRADVYENMATVAFEKGQFAEAVEFWQKAIAIDSNRQGVHSRIARALVALRRYEEAEGELQADLRASPRSGSSWCLLGQTYLEQKRYDQARESCAKAVAIDPNLSNAYYGLARACAGLKLDAEAKAHRATFKRLKTGGAERPYGFSPEEDLKKVRQSFTGLAIEAARLYQSVGRTGRAEELLKQAVRVDPADSAVRKTLATLYRFSNRIGEALAQCEKVAELEPDDPGCRVLIGVLALQANEIAKAERAFGRLTELAPNESVGYRELARLYLRTNQNAAEAKRLAAKAVATEGTAEHYYLLGWACQTSGDKAGAVAALEKAAALDPGNREIRRALEACRRGY